MTNDDIFRIAREQSAIDLGCDPDDFLAEEHKVVRSVNTEKARRYLTLPFSLQLVSYGGNIVASVSSSCETVARDYLARYPAIHCFETPNMHALDDAIMPLGFRTCFMAEYFLPDLRRLTTRECPYPTRLLGPADFAPLYLPEWSNALCADRRQLDVLGIGAYDGERLIGFAACSADCDTMWQIGIDVLPDYRRQGIAQALTANLACEILARGKVPFYCAAWSNIRSVRNAVAAGFRPAWVELTARPADVVAQMNHTN